MDQIPRLDLQNDYELPKEPIHLKRLKVHKASESKAIPGTSQLTKSPGKSHFYRDNALDSLPECCIRLERCDLLAAKFSIDKNPIPRTLSSQITEKPLTHMDNYELVIDLSTVDAEIEDHVASNNSPIFISSDDDFCAQNQSSDDEFLFSKNGPNKVAAKRRNTVHSRVPISTKKQKNRKRALNLLGKEANKNAIPPPVAHSKKSSAEGIESHSQKQQNIQVPKRKTVQNNTSNADGSHIDSVEQDPSSPCGISGLVALKNQLKMTEDRLKSLESERKQWELEKKQLLSDKADLEKTLQKKSKELDLLKSRFDIQHVRDPKKIKCQNCQNDAVDTNFEPPTCSANCMRILW